MFKRKARRSREWSKNNRVIDFEKAREARMKNREAVKDPQPEEIEHTKTPSKRKASKKNIRRNLYAAITMVVVAVIGFSAFSIFSVNARHAETLAERAALENQKEELEYELQNVDSHEYVEQQARLLLKLIKPGEVYYVVREGPPHSVDDGIPDR